jgi:hypothetical protein
MRMKREKRRRTRDKGSNLLPTVLRHVLVDTYRIGLRITG